MRELFDQFVIDEIEKGRARVDQRHRDIEGIEDRRVFDADDAGADDGEASRQPRQFDDVVAVEHVGAVERHVVGPERPGAAGDQNVGGGIDMLVAGVCGDFHLVRRDEAAVAVHRLDRIAGELMLQNLDLVIEGLAQPRH